jgi:hypothetical protein
MEPAVRLALIDALSAMAAEITATLDGTLVDVRLRGRDPEVVIVPAAHDRAHEPAPSGDPLDEAGDDGSTARISLRLPDALKSRAEAAAAAAGSSLNTWLIRAVATAVRQPTPPPPTGRGPRRYTGFANS